jgi:hypothetical protein
VRFSLSILGTEVLALWFGADLELGSEPETLRYDPTSTTACQTETAYSPDSVVLCRTEFGFHAPPCEH